MKEQVLEYYSDIRAKIYKICQYQEDVRVTKYKDKFEYQEVSEFTNVRGDNSPKVQRSV